MVDTFHHYKIYASVKLRYHISKGSELIIRWDNAPHHKQIKTFPHHKHVGETILESDEMEIKVILRELERMIKGSIS